MAVVPRSFLTFGASLLSARAGMRLRYSRKADKAQQRAFQSLMPGLAKGTVWKAAGVEPKMTYETYRRKVPLRSYEDLAPHIEEMKGGAADVLWPGRCQIYAMTSGTASGREKFIPVTEAMLRHFRRTGMDSILWYSARTGHASVFQGRHLFVGGSTALAPIPESAPFEAYCGGLGGIAALNLPGWVERHFYEPGAEIAEIGDWREKIAAITRRTEEVDISLLAGIPGWVIPLADSLRASNSHGKVRIAHLQGIWPNLECYIHGGVPLGPFHDELKEALGPTVNFHEVYYSMEAFIAAQDADSAYGLRMMTDAGVFFEFIPMSEFDESRMAHMGSKAVPISGVKTGVDYALVVTTPAGLARYVIGDVVRFLSTQPPRIEFVGRTGLQLNSFGEHVMEKEVTDALVAICRRNRWTIVNFHVAPLFTRTTTGAGRGRHEWWIELKAGTIINPTGPIMAPELDMEVSRVNKAYEAKRRGGVLEAPYVRLVMPGVFEHWMRHHGKWGGNNKMPRCRSDRVIADELGSSLQFAKD